mmetsp:Transcript_29082/g.54650  ORF Transcript_29082/g.54650 Transcript_29082/m.54650 type:complete len:327 (-) Transcript_29082:356-1336(-)
MLFKAFLLPFALSTVLANAAETYDVNSSLPRFNECVSSREGSNRISTGFNVYVGQAICVGDVQFGVFDYDMGIVDGKPYTQYRVELRRGGQLVRFFRGIGIPSTDNQPLLGLQHDGNLLFGYSSKQPISGCVVFPGRHTHHNVLELNADEDDITMTITDVEGDILWTWPTTGRVCYPELGPMCHSVLYNDQRISWDEYLCTYDADGEIEFQYGMDITGSLGLYRYGDLVYRPKGNSWIRGDYLHFQNDGHLTVYKQKPYWRAKRMQWTSDCIAPTAEKMVMTTDGDVQILNEAGAIVWTLLGSQYPLGVVTDARDTVPELCMTNEA